MLQIKTNKAEKKNAVGLKRFFRLLRSSIHGAPAGEGKNHIIISSQRKVAHPKKGGERHND